MTRSHSSAPCALLGVVGLALLAGAGCRSPLPPQLAQVPAGALEGIETRADLARWLDGPPARCLSLPRAEACEWRIGPDNPRHAELSAVLGFPDRIGVICVIPLPAAPLAADACSLYPRRSNRDEFRVSSRAESKLTARAYNQVDGAGTLLEMIRLLGELPEWCTAIGERGRYCQWQLTNHSYGQGTIARVVGAELRQQVRWTCRFPPGEHLRPPDSCQGEGL